MTSRLMVFDKDFSYLADLDVTAFNRSWILNDYGKGSLSIPVRDMPDLADLLQFGNYIYATHDRLPDWGGVIADSKTWRLNEVIISVYGFAWVMNGCITPKIWEKRGTGGSIFTQLVEIAINTYGYKNIVLGDIDGTGGASNVEYYFYSLFQAIKKLCKDKSANYEFEPSLNDDGQLIFTANYFKKLGADVPVTLYEDINLRMETTPLRESGKIVNRVTAYGGGSTWQSRSSKTYSDEDSIAKYGVRHEAISGDVGQLLDTAKNKVEELKEPRITYKLTALDVNETFDYLRLGNAIWIEYYSSGLTGGELGHRGRIRIKQIQYDEEYNTAVLIGDEVEDAE